MTEMQQRQQCDGPHRPISRELACSIIRHVPSHVEVRAIAINGQTGDITVECYHDNGEVFYRFDEYG